MTDFSKPAVALSAALLTLAWICVWLAYPVISWCECVQDGPARQVTGMHGVVFAVAWGCMSTATLAGWMSPRVQVSATLGIMLGTAASMAGLIGLASTSLVVTPTVALLVSLAVGVMGALAMVRARSE